jgi:hypothetical protein
MTYLFVYSRDRVSGLLHLDNIIVELEMRCVSIIR